MMAPEIQTISTHLEYGADKKKEMRSINGSETENHTTNTEEHHRTKSIETAEIEPEPKQQSHRDPPRPRPVLMPPVTRQPIIILVRTPFLGEESFKRKVLEKLRWISTVFSRQKYPNRRLVLIHSSWIYFGQMNLGDVLYEWECHEEWEDVYVKLLQSRYRCFDPIKAVPSRWYDVFDCSQQFVFGVYINLRQDRQEAGFGYGLSGRHKDRCPLRALLLATRGHAICLDWGHPSDLGLKNVGLESIDGLADRLDHDVYVLAGARQRTKGEVLRVIGHPDDHVPQQPFARAIRNGHYLGSFSSELDALPNEVVEKLIAGVKGHLFTEAQAKRGRWIGWWELFFAEDYCSIAYHQWHFAVELQTTAIYRYILAHQYWASSTWGELAMDGISLLTAGSIYLMLDFCFAAIRPFSLLAGVIVAAATVLVVTIAWDVWIRYLDRGLLSTAQYDRPSHRVFLVEFVRAALYAPIITRPAFIVFYRYLECSLLSFRTQLWYWDIRHQDPSTAAQVEIMYIAVLYVISLALPWSAATWGDAWAWASRRDTDLPDFQASHCIEQGHADLSMLIS